MLDQESGLTIHLARLLAGLAHAALSLEISKQKNSRNCKTDGEENEERPYGKINLHQALRFKMNSGILTIASRYIEGGNSSSI